MILMPVCRHKDRWWSTHLNTDIHISDKHNYQTYPVFCFIRFQTTTWSRLYLASKKTHKSKQTNKQKIKAKTTEWVLHVLPLLPHQQNKTPQQQNQKRKQKKNFLLSYNNPNLAIMPQWRWNFLFVVYNYNWKIRKVTKSLFHFL